MATKAYLSQLSVRQKLYYVATLAAAAMIVGLGVSLEPRNDSQPKQDFTIEMSIRDLVPELGVTGKALAREFDLPLDISKNKPVGELGVGQDQFDDAIAHILSHRPTLLKYYVFVALVLFGFVFLTRLGKPDNTSPSGRLARYPRTPYVLALLVAVAVAGFALGKSPNPMEGAVKVFKAMAGLYPSVITKLAGFAFFVVLAIVGNKLICGWACPLGAMQELIYSIPVLRKLKRRKLPFWISNSIRMVLVALMLVLLFGLIGGKKGFVLYHNLNAFNLFDLEFETPAILITVIVTLALSLFLYRPFCQFICPFGFLSWLAERLSLVRVRVDRTKCDECGACVQACPSEAAKGIMERKAFRADCYSCARCLAVCPHGSLRYSSILFPRPSNAHEEKVPETGPAS